jgi:molybdopterin-guanine dinucleotide biosynthesis protein A
MNVNENFKRSGHFVKFAKPVFDKEEARKLHSSFKNVNSKEELIDALRKLKDEKD